MKRLVSHKDILHQQEHEWTCSFACIRSMINNFMTENEIIEKYNLKPHPYFSKDIKELNLLKDYDVIYGCDKKLTLNEVINLLKSYSIMLESMYEESHWMVLIKYIEKRNLLKFYDPYYNEYVNINKDIFNKIWKDKFNKDIKQDFIAIKR